MEWMASHAQSWDQYQLWCDTNAISKRFTQDYLRRWLQKHRPQVQDVRRQHEESVRRQSVMTRANRLSELEATYERLCAASLASGDDTAVFLKVEEAKGKCLERIARERGEFNRFEEDAINPADNTNRSLRDVMQGYAEEQRRIQEAKVVG